MPRFRVPYTVQVQGVAEVEAASQDDAMVAVRYNTPHADLVADGEIGEGTVFVGDIEPVED